MFNRRIIAWAAGSAVLLLALTGCMANPIENLIKDKVGEAVEGATGVKVDTDGNGMEWPSGWPSELPRPAGKLTGALTVQEGRSYTAILESDQGSYDAFVAKLKASGYSSTMETTTADGAMHGFSDGSWVVVLLAAPQDGGVLITYAATKE